MAYEKYQYTRSQGNHQLKFTNRKNLPDTIYRAAVAQNAKYNKGKVERSVTQLLLPPRIDMLRKKHFHEIEKDLSDEWWALFGAAVHYILELGKTPDMICEERFFTHIDGWDVSGACDVQEFHKDGSVSLTDYKITTAFVVMKDDDGVKPEWEQQLNMLAHMIALTKHVAIRSLSVVAIIRDFQNAQAQSDPLYPASPVVPISLPLWSPQRQAQYMVERVRLHRKAEMLSDLDLPMPECTDAERWSRKHSWAVMKIGGKRAIKVYYNEEEAEADLAKRAGKKPTHEVVFRPGKSVRCAGNYCQVAQWCDQWAAIREAYGNDNAEAAEETNEEQSLDKSPAPD